MLDPTNPKTIVKAKAVASLKAVGRDEWDSLAIPGWRLEEGGRPVPLDSTPKPYNPFVTYGFLRALEDAGCVGGRTGWRPAHVIVRDGDGTAIGAAPVYQKVHSQGEYVFDYGWADAFDRAGGRYYPKLQVCVPFTPAQGPRLLVGAAGETGRAVVARTLAALCTELGASSVHVTFTEEADAGSLGTEGFLIRNDTQFHFENRGYRTPDDFLTALASRKRKQIRRERRAALANGISIIRTTGDDISEADWDAFCAFYMDTGARKWGRPYLNRKFFSLLGERMRHSVCLIFAVRDGRIIAGALNMIGSDTLFGRYWGCIEDHPFLHFEVCYYQAIDFAITHGLARVEAGAQGRHKLARGYEASATRSAHYIAHPGLRSAIEDFLEQERLAVACQNTALNACAPFRKGS